MNSIRELGTCVKSNELVVAPSYRLGEFDSHAVDCPFVFRHGDEYRMTFVGWDGAGYRTGWARSADLRSWEKMGLLIDRGRAGTQTEHNVALTSILRENGLWSDGRLRQIDGRYVGTYHTYPSPGYEIGPGSIGLCYSSDLLEWELDEPVLTASEGEDWERGGLYKSWILEHESVFYLFYNAKNVTEGDWREQTGIARSNDLRTWRRHPANPVVRNGPPGSFDELFASDPCVLRGDEGWYLFYFGVSRDGHARDGVARSADLLEWSQDHVPILDAGAPGAVDDRHAHKPCVIARDGALYHFYCAVGDRAAGSGTAGGVEHYQSRGISYAVWGGAPG